MMSILEEEDFESPSDSIETTQDELDGFYVVKSILRQDIDVSRISMRDVRSYCGILLDDNNRKPICRLRFNSSKKYVSLFHAEDEERVQIETVDGYLPVCESAEAGGSELPCRRVDTDATSPSHPATNPHLTSLLLAVPFTSAALSSKMNVTKPFAYLDLQHGNPSYIIRRGKTEAT